MNLRLEPHSHTRQKRAPTDNGMAPTISCTTFPLELTSNQFATKQAEQGLVARIFFGTMHRQEKLVVLCRVRPVMPPCAFKLFNLASPRRRRLASVIQMFPWLGAGPSRLQFALRHLSYAHWRCQALTQRVGKVGKMPLYRSQKETETENDSNQPQAVYVYISKCVSLGIAP